jgi:hypothetical protein
MVGRGIFAKRFTKGETHYHPNGSRIVWSPCRFQECEIRVEFYLWHTARGVSRIMKKLGWL